MGLEKLGNIFAGLKSRYPTLFKRVQEAEILACWDTSVGTIIAKHSRTLRIQNQVLWVEVDHPIWKSELHYRKNQILDLINKEVSHQEVRLRIKDILFLSPRSSPLLKARWKK